ncbi:hypothetical protein ROHU_000773 [Labeo rohita]|uniref:Uncharacterized protein n=1 Tax=Labeo rohita TaxID=84645 RepID=A0A498P3N4_LABRO|nr:hypothetical protein ROHU_000773 [Labeo rohita]
MGLLLGITEWRSHFNDKLVLKAFPQVPSEIKKFVLEDSMSDMSSVLSLNEMDNEEEVELSTSSSSPRRVHQRDDDNDDGGDDDDEDEQMYELVSEHTEETDSSDEEDKENPLTADQPDEEVNDELDQHKAIIEDIRKTEFGIGVELNEEGQNLMKKQQARLGRSLERLSTELYSKDTHFVLELIQNADDNGYPDGGEQPALAFVVEKDCITILNNECGFEENNIRAICDVGRSTKGKHKYGYIGDFDIPSSREDVDRDSSWNQWLRSEIPQLFVHAMDVFSVRAEWNMMFLH